jgi:hypothetical protein
VQEVKVNCAALSAPELGPDTSIGQHLGFLNKARNSEKNNVLLVSISGRK